MTDSSDAMDQQLMYLLKDQREERKMKAKLDKVHQKVELLKAFNEMTQSLDGDRVQAAHLVEEFEMFLNPTEKRELIELKKSLNEGANSNSDNEKITMAVVMTILEIVLTTIN